MSSTNIIIRRMTMYGGFPIFICGTIGNLLNLILLWETRQNSCGLIFLYSSIINCIVLFYGLFTRILSVGFDLDWSSHNLIWCKTRVAFTQTGFLISLTCLCLSSLDRFLSSCREEKYRKLSCLSLARISLFVISLLWLLHSIPYLISAQLLPNINTGLTSCSLIPNQAFLNYQIYVSLPIYLGAFPAGTLIITGLLTYRNLTKLQNDRQRQLIQKQLTIMMLIQIPVVLCSMLPYVVFMTYSSMTSTYPKSAYQRSVESLMTHVVTLLFYMTYACPFYVYLASSKSFRENFKQLICCRKLDFLRNNQIQPYSTNRTRTQTATALEPNETTL